ncbi:P-type DNA transfer ATPase VirB11 [Phenylobacterium sp.]|uniref:P-type DNA transfer ATPase VirB11 n=1 Tax=Phenylobacterium sp. TaxID=1871053 RepID=UPI0012076647|nr:P-type DNA transfer ATPase VirB11 [Phenylobacterium sp.]THD63900.1 MAG: P-type DNA transfer ATPase VirB11 [Phenylobacterium sp.]
MSAEAAVYLRTYLGPLAFLLERSDVTDIFVNMPGEAWTETVTGKIERHAAPQLDETTLWRLARQIASLSNQGVNREHPLLAATLPDGERVQIIAPPATRGPLAIAVRKHVVADLSLDDYERSSAFADTRTDGKSDAEALNAELRGLLDRGQTAEFLRQAVRGRKNIIVAGGTSTGKTTFLNALLKEIPREERLILIEDAAEVQLDHPNAVGLIAVRGENGEARVTAEDLVQASLRMRPDRIILGELRGREATDFLRAINTGHPGSITTLHADSPRGAVDQLSLLVLQAGLNLGRAEIADYVRSIVDVFVQLSRRDGRRMISEIVFQQQA